MATKLEQCKAILQHIEDPTTLQIQRIAEEVGCSERWCWKALSLLREEQKEIREEFKLLQETIKDALYLQYILANKMIPKEKITLKVRDYLNDISERLYSLQDKFELEVEGPK